MRTTSRAKTTARHRRRSADGPDAAGPSAASGGLCHSHGPHEPSGESADEAAEPSAGLGASPHEVQLTPRKRGRPRKRSASATPTRRSPPSKKKRKRPLQRARAETLGDSPHAGAGPARRRKALSPSWASESDEDGAATGFWRVASAIDGAAERRQAAGTRVVPGASLQGSPMTTSRWPPTREEKPTAEAKPPAQQTDSPRYRAGSQPDDASQDAGAGAIEPNVVTASAGSGVDSVAVASESAREDIETEQVEEGDASCVTSPADEGEESKAQAEPTADADTAALGDDATAATAAAANDSSETSDHQPATDAQPVILSPVQDEKKVTPSKAAASKKRRSLDATFASAKTTEFSVGEVSEIIAELYQEQEQDDRGLYSITTETVREQTAQCERSVEVDELSLEDFRRLLTYGEVSVESVSSTILPFLELGADDVLYDLGCGTGKILVQAVLQTACAKAVGIELMQNRVQEGLRALDRLDKRELALLADKSVQLVQGDICRPPASADMSDATVVFINNVMFGPTLMLKVMHQLESIPNLKRIVTLRKICERHRADKCQRAGNLCANYVDPPKKADIFVSWANKTQVYSYERVDFSLQRLTMAAIMGGEVAAKSVSAPRTKRGTGAKAPAKAPARRTPVRKTRAR